jgi:hypothetical protein
MESLTRVIPSVRDVVGGKPLPESKQPNTRGFPFTKDVSRGKPYFLLWNPYGWRFSSL